MPDPMEILDCLEESQLLSDESLRLVASWLSADSDLGQIAKQLVQFGLLTRFQVENVFRGNANRLLIESFELRDFLGKGGMGSVYLAFDRDRNQLVALKIMAAEVRRKVRHKRRFQRELQVGLQLQHPAIAQSYEARKIGGVRCLVMEYVPGQTMYRLVRREGSASIGKACGWLASVASALDYAHQLGVVHRDLKPSNIMITPTGKAKLLDMGLARWYADDHNEQDILGVNRIVGSFDYMAPEQALDSARADARADIYGLGCLLYFALAGQPPFAAVLDNREKLVAHRDLKPPPIQKFRKDLPPPLLRALEKMLSKNPLDRYQVAAEVQSIFERYALQYSAQKSDPASVVRSADDEIPSTDEPILLDESATDKSSNVPRSGLWHRVKSDLASWLGKRSEED